MHFSCPCRGCENKGLASCKWWSGGTSLLQMVIRRGRPLANDDPEGPASCKWSSRGAGLLQMMIWRCPASCKWWSRGTGLLQMIIRRAATVIGVIGDSSGCMKIDFFLRKILFRTQSHNLRFFCPLSISAFLVNKKSLFLQKCQCIELLTVF